MPTKPTAAGKSSIVHVDLELALSNIVSSDASAYLDLGCGVGNYSLAIAQRLGKDQILYALDLWEEGVETLKETARRQGTPQIKAMQADITLPLPLADDSVDVCLMATVLHDLPGEKRASVIGEIKRVLSPIGALALIEFKKIDQGPGPRKERRIGPADAKALFTPHGFRPEASVSLGDYMYLSRFSMK